MRYDVPPEAHLCPRHGAILTLRMASSCTDVKRGSVGHGMVLIFHLLGMGTRPLPIFLYPRHEVDRVNHSSRRLAWDSLCTLLRIRAVTPSWSAIDSPGEAEGRALASLLQMAGVDVHDLSGERRIPMPEFIVAIDRITYDAVQAEDELTAIDLVRDGHGEEVTSETREASIHSDMPSSPLGH